MGSKTPVHPDDHCDKSQSFPSAMHIAVALELNSALLPALRKLHVALEAKAQAFGDISKIGRTHLMDATPLTLGQEFGGYAEQLWLGICRVERALPNVYKLAQGGTAEGTGLITKVGFDALVAVEVAAFTALPFLTPNMFEALAANDSMLEVHGALNVAAAPECCLMKMAHDLRMLIGMFYLLLNTIGMFHLSQDLVQPQIQVQPSTHPQAHTGSLSALTQGQGCGVSGDSTRARRSQTRARSTRVNHRSRRRARCSGC